MTPSRMFRASWWTLKRSLAYYADPYVWKYLVAHPFLPLKILRINTYAGIIFGRL